MGLIDELKKLARPYEEDDYEDELDEEEEPEEEQPRNVRRINKVERPVKEVREPRESFDTWEPAPVREVREPRESARPAYRDSYEVPTRRGADKVVNINATTQVQVVLVKPEKFENASDIADHLRDKRTVVLNLETTQKEIARRLVDFLSGVAYAQEGKIKKISAATYLITPYNVDIVGGELIDELESNGMYF